MLRAPTPAIVRVACAVALCGVATSAAAQESLITIERRGPVSVGVEPGERTTLVFRVTNRGSVAHAVHGVLELPSGWRLVIPDAPLTIAPRTTELKLLRVSVPPGTQPGVHVLRYVVTRDRLGSQHALDSVLVTVAARQRIDASLVSAPRFAPAGDVYTSAFTVRNSGNAPTDVRLQLSSSDGFAARLDTAILHLEPGSARTVRSVVTTDAGLTRRVIHRVQLAASAVADPTVKASAWSIVEVIPRRPASVSRFYRIPAELALRQEDQGQSFSAQLRGAGFLTPSATTRVEFVARGPNPKAAFFGEQDQYSVGLASDRYRLRVGDQPYRLSRLSRSDYATFGGSADVTLGPFVVGAFSERDRRAYDFTRQQQHGGTVDLNAFKRVSVGAGFLHRSGINAGDVWSGRGALTPMFGTLVEWEYGHGKGQTGTGDAYAIGLNGRMGPASYTARREVVDTGFPGLSSGTALSGGNLAIGVIGKLTLVGSAYDFTTNRAQSQLFSTDARRTQVESGFRYGNHINAAYLSSIETGLLFPRGGAGRRTESIRFRVGTPPILGLRLIGESEHGRSKFDATPLDRPPFRRTALRGSFVTRAHVLSGSIEQFKGTTQFGTGERGWISAMFNAGLRVTPGTRLNVGVNGTRYTTGETFSTVDIGVGQQLGFGRRVGWQGRSLAFTPGSNPRQSMQQFEYLMPINMPIGAAAETGELETRLVDGNTGRPVPNVLVRFGGEGRITDGDGRARFSGFPAGTHYLEVDREKLGAGRLVSPVTPLPVDIRADEIQRVDLRVVRAVTLRGSVRVFDYQPGTRVGVPDSLVDAGPLGNAVLMLADGDTLRVVTDVYGRFSFAGLRPGQWFLSITNANLPQHHRLEQDRVELDLKGGELRDLELRILPVRPPVKLIAEAELTAGVPAAPTRRQYTVTRGDRSLMQVARSVYGSADLWPKIWLANPTQLPTPKALRAGLRLTIPDSSALTPEEIAARDAHLADPVERTYTVGKGDASLIFIARVMYDDGSLWPKIWVANLDRVPEPRRLRAGMRLRIPAKAPLTQREIAARDAYLARR